MRRRTGRFPASAPAPPTGAARSCGRCARATIGFSPAVFGLSIIAFSLSRSLWLSLVILVFAGFGMMLQIASSNTIIQTVVDDDKRGRIMSLYTMAFMGMAPFGCLLAGALAGRIGAPYTVMLGGLCCLLGSAAFILGLPMFRRAVRPVYERMGIISSPGRIKADPDLLVRQENQ